MNAMRLMSRPSKTDKLTMQRLFDPFLPPLPFSLI